jgi:pimeloyl-ACP methyl ester carboxylesterase
MLFRLILTLCVLTVATAAAEESQWRFDGWDGPPVNVFTYVPESSSEMTTILIVIHGWSREAERYFDDWKAQGEQHGFVVVVPHFPVEDFPSSNDYNLGHVFEAESTRVRPRETWTFAAIEPLFDEVVARLGGKQTEYTLFGHSAGSQFVHRFLYYMPEARVSRYLAGNAGWYTMPEFDTEYPYGLENAAISEEQLVDAFQKDVVILLGKEDIDTTDPDLRNTPEAKRQGINRLARGLTYYSAAQANAEKLGVDLHWQLVLVDDAGHKNGQMAPAAALLVE